MRPSSLRILLPALLLAACGGGDSDSDSGGAPPAREAPEATIARWVEEGDCGLFTDRHVAEGYPSVAEGRRACQAEADRTPVEPYRVQATHAEGDEALVVLAVARGRRLVFSLVAAGERGWRIDGYEERRVDRSATGSAEVLEAFERRTGERLDRLPDVSTPTYEVLGFREIADAGTMPENLSEGVLALVDRFGVFNVYVAESAKEAGHLLEGTRADERGIHWKRRPTRAGRPPRWGAEKRYGNVLLSWTAGETRRTDGRFDLLDAILRAAVRRAGAR